MSTKRYKDIDTKRVIEIRRIEIKDEKGGYTILRIENIK
jgi:hypothetical protein